jgi:acyl carrier protein
METVRHLVVIAWLFYEDEEESNSNPNTYSAIMDSIVEIMWSFSEDLEKEFNEEKVKTLAKIVCLIKCEIHKDKDIVFLDMLIELFNKHMGLYR